MGPPRSGTTLMQSILRAHPNVVGLELETRLFFRRNFVDLILPEFDDAKLKEIIQAARDPVDLLDKIALQMRQEFGASAFVEKTPEHALRAAYILRKFPKSKLVFLVRDPRDAFLSALRNPTVKFATSQKYAAIWGETISVLATIIGDPRVKVVHYEDLCIAPERIVREVMEFVGVPFHPFQLDSSKYSQTAYAQEKGHKRLMKAISPETVGSWRKKIKPSDLEYINTVLSTKMRSLGYISEVGINDHDSAVVRNTTKMESKLDQP